MNAHREPLRRRIVIQQPRSDLQPSLSWKKNFLRDPENEWLCDIPDDFIKDRFNLYGMNNLGPFSICCDVILSNIKLEDVTGPIVEDVKKSLKDVYGMIHARYIMSPDGIRDVIEKYKKGTYGACPRYACRREHLLPIGESSKRGKFVKAFCPKCRCIYEPRPEVSLDGAYFGPNIAHVVIDELGLMSKKKEYKKFERLACGFRVYDPQADQ